MYHEVFANHGPAWVPDSDLTQEEYEARVREREAANARYREIEAQQHQEVRDGWKLTVGKLKAIIADLPDDMPVIVQEELGIRDVVPTVDENPHDIAGPVLDMGGW